MGTMKMNWVFIKLRGNKALDDTKRPLSIVMETETKGVANGRCH